MKRQNFHSILTIFLILGFTKPAQAAETAQNYVETFGVSCLLQNLTMDPPYSTMQTTEIKAPVFEVKKFLGHGIALDCRIINRMSHPLRIVFIEELKNIATTKTRMSPAQDLSKDQKISRWLSGRSLEFIDLPPYGTMTMTRQTNYETTYAGRLSWVEATGYQSHLLSEVALHFLCIGIFTVAAIINFFTTLLQKEKYTRTYLTYTLLAIVSSLIMTGHLRPILESFGWPNAIWYSDFFPLLMTACLLVFAVQYLDLQRDFPKLKTFLYTLAALSVGQALITPYLHRLGFAYIHDLFYYLCSTLTFLAGIYRIQRKDLAVWYFISSLVILALGSSAYSLSKASLIPHIFAFEFGFSLGVGGALLIASAGLIARGDLMRRQWEENLKQQNNYLETRVQEEMNKLRENERHLDESRRSEAVAQLAAGIAHEINNPLAIVGMGLTILENLFKKRNEDFSREKDIIKRIGNSSERMAKIVGIIRILAEKKRSFKMEPVDLREMMDSMTQLFQDRCESLQIKFEVEFHEERLLCNVSRSHTVEVLISVIQNAIDFLEKESGERWIRLTLKGDSQPMIEVSNSGPPIPDEQLPHLFQPFFTTKEPGKGQGLGLCHARSLMEAQDGNLSYSVVGGHTCFVVKFSGQDSLALAS